MYYMAGCLVLSPKNWCFCNWLGFWWDMMGYVIMKKDEQNKCEGGEGGGGKGVRLIWFFCLFGLFVEFNILGHMSSIFRCNWLLLGTLYSLTGSKSLHYYYSYLYFCFRDESNFLLIFNRANVNHLKIINGIEFEI